MPDSLAWFPDNLSLPESALPLLISTTLLILGVIALGLSSQGLSGATCASSELRGRLLVNSRNAPVLLAVFGLVFIWGEQLRSLARSIVPIAVAFVVATKELILCVSGSILKGGAGSCSIGDRIQVKDFRGDVIDQTLLTTTLLEVRPGKASHQRAGRMIVLPIALFVSEPVTNEGGLRLQR